MVVEIHRKVISKNMKLTIVTVTYDDVSGLNKTIESVKKQNFRDFEHIIVDKLSADGSKELVGKYMKNYDNVSYIREDDNGIFEAMNKGLVKAKGDYINFLNSGDSYADESVLKEIFAKERGEGIIYGDINQLWRNGKKERWSLSGENINIKFFIKKTIYHQASFIRREILEIMGGYDESLMIVADYDFFIRAIIRERIKLLYLPMVMVDYDAEGVSSRMTNSFIIERTKVLMRYIKGTEYWRLAVKLIYYKIFKVLYGEKNRFN